MRTALGFPQHIYVAVTGYIRFGSMGSWNSIRPYGLFDLPTALLRKQEFPRLDSSRGAILFGGSSPRSCPPLFRRHLGWRGCLESHISSGFSARCAPITGNRAPAHPSMRWVRRGVKRRFSFVALLFVLYGSGSACSRSSNFSRKIVPFIRAGSFPEITAENLSTAIGVLERPLEGSLVVRLYPFVPAISGGKQSSHH